MRDFYICYMLVLLLFPLLGVRGQRVLLSATGPLRIQQEKFVLQCQPDNAGEGFQTITSIEISRRITGEINFKPVVRITIENNIDWIDDDIRERSSKVEGRVGKAEGAFIRYEIEASRTDCTDASQYKCYIFSNPFNLSQTVTVFPQVTAERDLELIASPSNAGIMTIMDSLPNNAFTTDSGNYTLGTSVWIACYVNAGNPPAHVTWCFRRKGSIYTRQGLFPVTFDTSGEEPRTACFLTRTSAISYIVTEEDEETEFLCELQPQNSNRNKSCGDAQIGAMFQLSLFTEPETTTSTTTTTDQSIYDGIDVDGSDFLASQDNGLSVSRTSYYAGDLGRFSQKNLTIEITRNRGVTFMVIGALLLAAVFAVLVLSVIFFFKSKKIKKEAELQMIRSTYDSLADTNKATDVSGYAVLRTGRGQEAGRPDSDGYMTPSALFQNTTTAT